MLDKFEFSFSPRVGKKEGENEAYIVFSKARGQNNPLATCKYGSDAVIITDALNTISLSDIPMFMDDDRLMKYYNLLSNGIHDEDNYNAIVKEMIIRKLDL